MNTNTDPVRALIANWRSESTSDDQSSDYECGEHSARSECADELEAALAQQPACVDEAMVERAVAAVMSAPTGISVEAYVRIVLEAALASAPPSAPVGVDGFDKRFAEMLLGILNDVQDELGFTDEDKLCANGSAEIVAEIRELKRVAALAQQPAAPSGEAVGAWVTVPRVPTDAMLSAAQSAWLNDTLRRTTTLWRAMLASAPQQPVGVDAPEIDLEAIAWAYRKLLAFGCYSSEQGAMMGDRLNLMLLAAQQQGGRDHG